MNVTQMSIAYSPESEILEDVVRSATVNLFVSNARDLISVIQEQFPLPPGIEIPPDINVNITAVEEFLKSLVRVDAYNSSAALRGIYVEEETTRKVIAAVEFSDDLYGEYLYNEHFLCFKVFNNKNK